MQVRHNQGCRPQITFTSDFHELVQGDLFAGPCVLRYDPLRLVELGDAADESHRIRACVRCHPMNTEWQGLLELPSGQPLAELADSTGQGLMLSTTFEIPPGCDELEVWFSCTHADGTTHWDSDFGKNHWLRFGLADLTIKLAKVAVASHKNSPQDAFEFECATVVKVDDVKLRWRLPSNASFPRQVTPLACTSSEATGKIWKTPSGGLPIPRGATVSYDILYRVGGREFKDDNQGRWYIAD